MVVSCLGRSDHLRDVVPFVGRDVVKVRDSRVVNGYISTCFTSLFCRGSYRLYISNEMESKSKSVVTTVFLALVLDLLGEPSITPSLPR